MNVRNRPSKKAAGCSIKNAVNQSACTGNKANGIKNAVAMQPKSQGPAKIKGAVS